jgi:hypothetical protein
MFGAAFAGILLDATLYRRTQTEGDNGDVTSSLSAGEPVKGYREATTDRMRRELGYSDREGRLLVLQVFSGAVVPAPKRGDEIDLDGTRWVIGDMDSDPARTHWLIRATRV